MMPPGKCIVCHAVLIVNEGLLPEFQPATGMFFCPTKGCCRQGLVTMVMDMDEPAGERKDCGHSLSELGYCQWCHITYTPEEISKFVETKA